MYGHGGHGGWGQGTTPVVGTGLPFGGIPPEYAERIAQMMRGEEDIPVPEVEFQHRSPDQWSFTLRRFLAPHTLGLLLAFVLVAGESLFALVGPYVTGYGIDNGVLAGDLRVLRAHGGCATQGSQGPPTPRRSCFTQVSTSRASPGRVASVSVSCTRCASESSSTSSGCHSTSIRARRPVAS